MENEWCDRVSSLSLQTLTRKKMNRPEMVPLTSDLEILRQDMENKMASLKKELMDRPCPETWRRLATVTNARVTIFNKRRSGEASRLKVKDFQERQHWTDNGCEAIKSGSKPS